MIKDTPVHRTVAVPAVVTHEPASAPKTTPQTVVIDGLNSLTEEVKALNDLVDYFSKHRETPDNKAIFDALKARGASVAANISSLQSGNPPVPQPVPVPVPPQPPLAVPVFNPSHRR